MWIYGIEMGLQLKGLQMPKDRLADKCCWRLNNE